MLEKENDATLVATALCPLAALVGVLPIGLAIVTARSASNAMIA
jgi:hypothetical protein